MARPLSAALAVVAAALAGCGSGGASPTTPLRPAVAYAGPSEPPSQTILLAVGRDEQFHDCAAVLADLQRYAATPGVAPSAAQQRFLAYDNTLTYRACLEHEVPVTVAGSPGRISGFTRGPVAATEIGHCRTRVGHVEECVTATFGNH